MPSITINGVVCEFEKGQMILEVAKANGIEIPHYCYHEGLSIVASCRICLVEIWAPNPRNDNKLESIGKLVPACQTAAGDGQVVYSNSPKAIRNQNQVMELLLINHPLDCPVCDQAGECSLQDYSFQYGRGVSRFEEQKVKQPKKNIGPHVYLYSDRCIMCTRCVRFTREVSGTGELCVVGRGNDEQIDLFPGVALDNEIASNVIDLCPVGALLDKDFLFAQRVWRLKSTPGIDPITASGDNIWVEHNEGRIYRVRPRTNPEVNKWWITDEVRYGWKFVHADNRLRTPMRRQNGILVESDYIRAYKAAAEAMKAAAQGGRRLGLMISPMITCEEAYVLAKMVRGFDPDAALAVGPVPVRGRDKVFPPGTPPEDPRAFKLYAEKAPNACGVRRVIEAVAGDAKDAEGFIASVRNGEFGAAVIVGGYPDDWAPDELVGALHGARQGAAGGASLFVVLIDTLGTELVNLADVVFPGATFAEKAGTFENAPGRLQAFEQAIPVIELAKTEGQIALDLSAAGAGERPGIFDAAAVRAEMGASGRDLACFATDVHLPVVPRRAAEGMEMVEL